MKSGISIAILAFLAIVNPAVAADKLIMTKSGQGATALRPFTIGDEWEVQWQAEGMAFNLILHPLKVDNLTNKQAPETTQAIERVLGMSPKVIAMSSGTGSHYVPKGGKYYLEINAMGNWTITIVQIQ